MRRVEKIVGTAFTRRKTTHEVAETPEEIEAVFRQLDDCGDDPWANHRREVESARAALALEIAKKPKGYRFKERNELGWYLERLIIQGTLVQHHIDQGAASWAAHQAALFGETFCELQIKLARERIWMTGRKIHDGGDAARRGNQSERVAAVDALCSGPDRIGKTAAFALVAESERVTPKAIETDYYKARKRPKSGD